MRCRAGEYYKHRSIDQFNEFSAHVWPALKSRNISRHQNEHAVVDINFKAPEFNFLVRSSSNRPSGLNKKIPRLIQLLRLIFTLYLVPKDNTSSVYG